MQAWEADERALLRAPKTKAWVEGSTRIFIRCKRLSTISSDKLCWTGVHALDEGDFTEGHELDRKWKVAKEMVGRGCSQEEAKRLLAKFE